MGRARHSVRAAPATSACKIPPASPSRPAADQARASGGGRSRAATPFACGAGTLWRPPCPSAHACLSPRRVCGSGAGPATKMPESTETGRNNTIITMNERLQTRVARATGPYRPATRRTERVRRSFCQRTPFVIGASSFFRHLTFVLRHSQTETIKNPRNITFLQMKPHPTITQRNVANPWVVGRVTPCAPLLTSKSASYPSCHFPNAFKKQIMQVPAFTTCYVRSQSAQDAGRVATGFPLPSTGRGIEGEGWSYPEPPPVRFFLYQPHPGFRLETTTSAPQTGHPPCPRAPPVVDGVALRLRLPAEQALCGVVSPGACA